MDIQRLLRTYIHVNDPERRNVTIKLAIAAIALATVGLLVATQTGWLGADGTGGQDPGFATESEATADDHQDACMPEDELAQWLAEHPEAKEIETTTPEPGLVCVSYTAP